MMRPWKKLASRRQLLVIVPFALFLIYISFFAIAKYRSESIYAIRDLATKENYGIDLGLFGGSGSNQGQDATIVMEYLQSLDMLKNLDAKFHLRERYGSSHTEILERLLWFSNTEDFLTLYRKRLKIVPDEVSRLTHISFDSTDPELSLSVLEYLLNAGQAFLNKLNHRRAQEKITFITEQLEENRNKLDEAIKALENFQNQYQVVDPAADVATLHSIIGNLESEIVLKTAEYNQLINYMSPNSIDALKLKTGIEELQAALTKTKNKLAGDNNGRLNELLFGYQKLKSNVDFATEVYKSTLVQYEKNKIETLQESKIFEVIAAPHLPEGHVYPQRIKLTLTAIILILVFHKIIQMLWTVIQDHKD